MPAPLSTSRHAPGRREAQETSDGMRQAHRHPAASGGRVRARGRQRGRNASGCCRGILPAAAPQDSSAVVEASLALDRSTRRLIQQGLRNEGFDPGTPDGLFGPRTRAAIREYNRGSGLGKGAGQLHGSARSLAPSPSDSAPPSPQSARRPRSSAAAPARVPAPVDADEDQPARRHPPGAHRGVGTPAARPAPARRTEVEAGPPRPPDSPAASSSSTPLSAATSQHVTMSPVQQSHQAHSRRFGVIGATSGCP